jgi:hypothetical protein
LCGTRTPPEDSPEEDDAEENADDYPVDIDVDSAELVRRWVTSFVMADRFEDHRALMDEFSVMCRDPLVIHELCAAMQLLHTPDGVLSSNISPNLSSGLASKLATLFEIRGGAPIMHMYDMAGTHPTRTPALVNLFMLLNDKLAEGITQYPSGDKTRDLVTRFAYHVRKTRALIAEEARVREEYMRARG